MTRKRMETCDDDFVAAASDFIKRQHDSNKPFFCWVNTTHMHLRTHTKKRSLGQAGRWQSPYHDTMVDHDKNVGQLLNLLDKLEITDDTIVMYGTDNGPHMNSWPDGAMTPFRSEKNTNWEGAFRVPLMIRWPGRIPAGVVSNEIVQHHDWLPTFLAAAGDPDVVDKLKEGHEAAGKTFKVHIDGYNLLPYLTGEADESPRKGLIYFSDDGDLVALRFDNWKLVFMEQRTRGTLELWAEPFVPLRDPQVVQPTNRSVRARRRHVEHVLGLVHEQGLHDHGSAGPRGRLPGNVQGLPAAPEGSELHDRPSAREDGRRSQRSTRLIDWSGMVAVPGGTFRMGSDIHYPEEAPSHSERVEGFSIDRHQTTNRQFAAFVEATGYVTVAERPLDPADFPGAPAENLVPGSMVFTMTPGPVDLRHLDQWWRWAPGASWRHPEGPGSSIAGRDRSSRRPRRLRGRRGVRDVGRQATADRGGVGARRPRRARRRQLRLG